MASRGVGEGDIVGILQSREKSSVVLGGVEAMHVALTTVQRGSANKRCQGIYDNARGDGLVSEGRVYS